MKILSILFILFFLSVQSVSAHVLKSSGTIGAVMHVQPEDDPIVGEESSFFFAFKDTTGRFAAQDCDCMFAILRDGGEVYSQPLFQDNTNPSMTNASVFYTFLERGVYTIKVTGSPRVENAFEPFILTYDMRVERTSDGESSEDQNWFTERWPILAGGTLGLLTLAFVVLKSRKHE